MRNGRDLIKKQNEEEREIKTRLKMKILKRNNEKKMKMFKRGPRL